MAARDAHSAPRLSAPSTRVPTESALLEKRQSLGLTAMDVQPVRLAMLQQPRLCARLVLQQLLSSWIQQRKLKQRTSRTEISLMLCRKIHKYQHSVNAAMDLLFKTFLELLCLLANSLFLILDNAYSTEFYE
jgi:hypothetical protein